MKRSLRRALGLKRIRYEAKTAGGGSSTTRPLAPTLPARETTMSRLASWYFSSSLGAVEQNGTDSQRIGPLVMSDVRKNFTAPASAAFVVHPYCGLSETAPSVDHAQPLGSSPRASLWIGAVSSSARISVEGVSVGSWETR